MTYISTNYELHESINQVNMRFTKNHRMEEFIPRQWQAVLLCGDAVTDRLAVEPTTNFVHDVNTSSGFLSILQMGREGRVCCLEFIVRPFFIY